jgi:hypothetical protein
MARRELRQNPKGKKQKKVQKSIENKKKINAMETRLDYSRERKLKVAGK